MSQLIKPQIKWTQEKIDLLISEYPLGDKEELAKRIGVTRKVLKYAAKRFKVKSLKEQRKFSALKLLDESVESYYWHGFIMADGNISHGNAITLILSPKDEDQIFKFKNFLGSDLPVKYSRYNTTYANGTRQVRFRVSDIYTCEHLRELYKVGANKTKFPPNISPVMDSDKKLLAFFIGFFDGDGCFCCDTKGIVTGMKIECHSSWLEPLQMIADGLGKYFDIHPKVGLNTRGYSKFTFGRYKNFINLKRLAIEWGIPMMTRKWDKVDLNRKHKI